MSEHTLKPVVVITTGFSGQEVLKIEAHLPIGLDPTIRLPERAHAGSSRRQSTSAPESEPSRAPKRRREPDAGPQSTTTRRPTRRLRIKPPTAPETKLADIPGEHIDRILSHLDTYDKQSVLSLMLSTRPGTFHNDAKTLVARLNDQERPLLYRMLNPSQNPPIASQFYKSVAARAFLLARAHGTHAERAQLYSCSENNTTRSQTLAGTVFHPGIHRAERKAALQRLLKSLSIGQLTKASQMTNFRLFTEYFSSHATLLETDYRHLIEQLPAYRKVRAHTSIPNFVVRQLEAAPTREAGIQNFVAQFDSKSVSHTVRRAMESELREIGYAAPLERTVRDSLLHTLIKTLGDFRRHPDLRDAATAFICKALRDLPLETPSYHAFLEQLAAGNLGMTHSNKIERTLMRAITGPERTENLCAKTFDRYIHQEQSSREHDKFESPAIKEAWNRELRGMVTSPDITNENRSKLLTRGFEVGRRAEFEARNVAFEPYTEEEIIQYANSLRRIIVDPEMYLKDRITAAYRIAKAGTFYPLGSGLRLFTGYRDQQKALQEIEALLKEVEIETRSHPPSERVAEQVAVVRAYAADDEDTLQLLLAE